MGNGNQYAMVVKVFYCIAKHFSGYYINYLCFLGHFGDNPIMTWSLLRRLLLLAGWGTTIAMFLQTPHFAGNGVPWAHSRLHCGHIWWCLWRGESEANVRHDIPPWPSPLQREGLGAQAVRKSGCCKPLRVLGADYLLLWLLADAC